ncbi:MAG: 50S ribosomal protein L30 [Alphaproteobacteria bacterium]
MAKKTLKVTLNGSHIGCTENQKGNLVGLGLKRRHATRELEDTPAVRGMINKVSHLVSVED